MWEKVGAVVFLIAAVMPAAAQQKAAPLHGIVADYDSELRRADGRVDVDQMVARLKELGVNTYFWLVWHAATDWDDLRLFLPKAAEAGIDVWVYLVPPSESPPQTGLYSEPFRLDYDRWAEEIAKLSLDHPNLKAWVIDDFYANREILTPDKVQAMQRKAKAINAELRFLPLMYFGEITRRFVDDYREAIDGVVVAYPQGREEVEQAWAILNDVLMAAPNELRYPWAAPSQPGEFAAASQTATVEPGERYSLRFNERDDFTGATVGYHFKQVLVDGAVAWEEDVAGGAFQWREVTVDVTDQVRGKNTVSVAFRLFDKKGVSNFGVRWQLRDLRSDGCKLAADLTEPKKWQAQKRGAFEAGFGEELKEGQRRFHIPFIVMTAAEIGEFRQRHGDPATPERVAEWVRMCLQAWQDGRCDGVVTYCLNKAPQSPTFTLVRDLFAR